MIAVLQRVDRAVCRVDGAVTGEIGTGLLVLLGVAKEDTEEDARLLAEKVFRCRIFKDGAGKMNLSLPEVGGGALVISNFTLLADYAHGNRPSYFDAAPPAVAKQLYEYFTDRLRETGVPVGTGRFGAEMHISIEANGPVTIVMDSKKLRSKKENPS